MKNRTVMFMAAAIAALSVFSGIAPASMKVWFIEMIWAWGLVAILALTWPKFSFSVMSYTCFFVWCVLQIIGAHWTFEHVPMGWIMEPLGLSRNPYDRIAHFAVGFFAFPLAELFWRRGSVRTRMGAAFFSVMTTVAMAGLWEIVEWLYAAVDGGKAGVAFLGSQGDEWDAQKDILCDTLGALCASVLFLIPPKRNPNLGNILRICAIAVPWLCTAIVPILRVEGFCQSPFRVLFFESVMVPFGNIAMLGMTSYGQGRTFGMAAALFLAGVVLPPVIALLFVWYWRRWQFFFVWLGYVILLAWDTFIASVVILVFIEGGELVWR